jgi:hypothetical protein
MQKYDFNFFCIKDKVAAHIEKYKERYVNKRQLTTKQAK